MNMHRIVISCFKNEKKAQIFFVGVLLHIYMQKCTTINNTNKAPIFFWQPTCTMYKIDKQYKQIGLRQKK